MRPPLPACPSGPLRPRTLLLPRVNAVRPAQLPGGGASLGPECLREEEAADFDLPDGTAAPPTRGSRKTVVGFAPSSHAPPRPSPLGSTPPLQASAGGSSSLSPSSASATDPFLHSGELQFGLGME